MTMRITSMYSGLDTESIISELISAKSQSVTKLKNEKTKLGWKKEAWQTLNTKIYSFFNTKLADMRFESAYTKKKTKSSNESIASVVASSGAVDGSQSLKVKSLAASGHLTGAQIKQLNPEDASNTKISNSTKLSEISSELDGKVIKINNKEITLTGDMTVNSLVSEMKNAGVNASFDTNTQRFFVSSKGAGAANDFTLSSTSTASDGSNILRYLGMDESTTEAEYNTLFGASTNCKKSAASDAEIELNGAKFTSNTNSFTINGLTITCNGTTTDDEVVTLSTSSDTDGIYDMIKDFFTDYNDMINDICKKYNADSAKDYDVLTSEQKEAMTDEEIEKWESTIKGSLLRRDSTLSTVMSSLSSIMSEGVTLSSGKKMYLSNFGIGTLSYFEAEDNEHYAYHIDGDEDDSKTSTNADKLKSMIATDPEAVSEYFATLSKKMYDKLNTLMASSDYSSVYKIYNDKQLDKDDKSYDEKITKAQEKLDDYQDRWYDKFSKMEVALAKLQSNQSAISGLLGNSN